MPQKAIDFHLDTNPILIPKNFSMYSVPFSHLISISERLPLYPLGSTSFPERHSHILYFFSLTLTEIWLC